MKLQNLLKSRAAPALLAGILYVTWKSLAQYFGLDDSTGGLVTDAFGGATAALRWSGRLGIATGWTDRW